MSLAAGPDQPALRPLVDLLPVAGGSGTLSDRFLDPETSQGAAGWLRAKTGSLTATNALAGIVTDRGGRVLTFALISNGAGQVAGPRSTRWPRPCGRAVAGHDTRPGRPNQPTAHPGPVGGLGCRGVGGVPADAAGAARHRVHPAPR